MFNAPILGERSKVQPSANSTPGMAMGIRIRDQARLRPGMSVRSISQANSTARARVTKVPTAAIQMVVTSAE